MKTQNIFKKVGGILAEINEQYEYLSQSSENLNDLELELLSANADFLAEHIKVLRKLNLAEGNAPENKVVSKEVPISHTEEYKESVKPEVIPAENEEDLIKPWLPEEYSSFETPQQQLLVDLTSNNEEENDPQPGVGENPFSLRDEEAEPELHTPISQWNLDPVASESKPEVESLNIDQESKAEGRDAPELVGETDEVNIVNSQANQNPSQQFVEEENDQAASNDESDGMKHGPDATEEEGKAIEGPKQVEQKIEPIAEKPRQVEQNPEPTAENPEEIAGKPEPVERSFNTFFSPEVFPEKKPEPASTPSEENSSSVSNEVVIEAKTVHVEIPVKAEETPRVMTLNEMISAQRAQAAPLGEMNKQKVSDLKAIISLNDKLLFIKDLFNGYSLAYSEAIEIINRYDSFEAADNFLKSNYSVKNNWSSKQSTTDKFYELLNRRFAK